VETEEESELLFSSDSDELAMGKGVFRGSDVSVCCWGGVEEQATSVRRTKREERDRRDIIAP
jgi:hypothetical protein